MPLIVDWQAAHDAAELSLLTVPVFGAELILTLYGDVIVDASWQLSLQLDAGAELPPLACRVRDYLLAPHRQALQVRLLAQGGAYYRRVWQALLAIPLGETLSYSALAEQLGSGPRAVAGACRANPYAGLIPCHRVTAKSGIGGFMGCADGEMVELKRRILAAERQIAQELP